MRPDIVDLQEFYASPLGHVARRMIRRRVRRMWPSLAGLRVLGFGYATPFVKQYVPEAERVVAVMPAQQGVAYWPREGANVVALAEETDLPLPDAMFDRVVLVHAIEATDALRPMLREIWRVLAPGGRVLVVAPNRRGLWARVESTPFAHGRPYSQGQLTRLLRDNLFSPIQWQSALFVPPTRWGVMLRAAAAVERLGQRWFGPVAGVVMIEAMKQIYAATPPRVEAGRARARPIAVPEGNRG
jgi:SAM-dependent methyltransferase